MLQISWIRLSDAVLSLDHLDHVFVLEAARPAVRRPEPSPGLVDHVALRMLDDGGPAVQAMLTARPLLIALLLLLHGFIAASVCTKDVVRNVQALMNNSHLKELDCRLYTPAVTDYQQKCRSSIMRCFAVEIKVLIKEWDQVPNQGFRLDRRLSRLADKLNTKSEPGCLQCELFKEENATVFLKDLLWTLEMMNTDQKCLQRT